MKGLRAENYLKSLRVDSAKIEAIRHTEGPLLIIAGPGSGKTRTIVEKVIFLLVVQDIDPQRIIVSTFTEKAARELVSRISDRLIDMEVNLNVNDLYIGTLHSIFLRLLEEHREYTSLSKNYRILDGFDLQYMIYKNIWSFGALDPDGLLISPTVNNWEKADAVIRSVSKIGEEGINLAQMAASSIPGIRVMSTIYQKYRQLLELENAMDFTLIQSAFLEMLENNAGVAEQLKEQFQFILIDEYQDTNTIQEIIIFKLLSERQNLCVVGDDDQGLYRFRGATVRNILTFTEHFTQNKCKVIRLEINYRSHPEIIRFYGNWMQQTSGFAWGRYRYQKNIKAQTGREYPDFPVVLKISANDDQDAWEQSVCDFIRFCERENVIHDKNQICFLYRSVKNAKVLSLIEKLSQSGISVFAPRSDMFFERPETQTALGLLLLLFRDVDAVFVANNIHDERLLGYYKDCQKLVARQIRQDPEGNRDLTTWLGETSKLFYPMRKNTNHRLSTLLYECFSFDIMSRYLDVDLAGKAQDQRAAYNLGILSQIITKFEAHERISVLTKGNLHRVLIAFFGYFLRFLREGGMEEFEGFDEVTPSGSVSFMTIHQAKGLEFPITIVGSLEAVPRKQYTDLDIQMEEEGLVRTSFEPLEDTKYFDFWRLYYTAFSRAKNLLVLGCNEHNAGHRRPSQYFNDAYSGVKDWTLCTDDLKLLRADPVSVAQIKKEYSYTSDIIIYESCPTKYKFFRALAFAEVRVGATLFGAVVHETIEDIHKAVLRGERDSLSSENIEHWFNRNYNSLKRALMATLDDLRREVALKQVLLYNERNTHQWDKIVEVEKMVSLVKGEYILKGKIDLIRGEDGMLDILDFKTDAVKPKVNDPSDAKKLAQYRRQLEIYAHILEERFGHKINKLHLYYTSADNEVPYITWDRGLVDVNQTIKGVDRIIGQIESKDYNNEHIEKTRKLCGNCDMRHYCKFI